MNSGLSKVIGDIFLSVRQIQVVPVRFRYYADKIARGPYSKKFGYKEPLFTEGPLPRLNDDQMVRHSIYKPKNSWSSERATHGQNDYIDILGGAKLDPAQVKYDVPKWLRGRKGKELSLLILKQKMLSKTQYEYENPTRWFSISRRIKYLYRYLNRKTKTPLSKQ